MEVRGVGSAKAHSPRSAGSTSFEFLISKPPCNYWINVNYEDALCSLAERYGLKRGIERYEGLVDVLARYIPSVGVEDN